MAAEPDVMLNCDSRYFGPNTAMDASVNVSVTVTMVTHMKAGFRISVHVARGKSMRLSLNPSRTSKLCPLCASLWRCSRIFLEPVERC